jgi:hypothetical protein
MKKLVIQFELRNHDLEEFEGSLEGWIADFMDSELADDLTYTILERK